MRFGGHRSVDAVAEAAPLGSDGALPSNWEEWEAWEECLGIDGAMPSIAVRLNFVLDGNWIIP
jgi:hypothetical protein